MSDDRLIEAIAQELREVLSGDNSEPVNVIAKAIIGEVRAWDAAGVGRLGIRSRTETEAQRDMFNKDD